MTKIPKSIEQQIQEAVAEGVATIFSAFEASEARREAEIQGRRRHAEAADLNVNPYALITRGLKKQGLSDAQIHQRLQSGDLESFKDVLDAELTIEKAAQDRLRAAEHAGSAEARIEAALATEKATAEAARQGQLARVWLTDNASTVGISSDMVEALTDAEAVQLAFGNPEGGEQS